ncbi:LLM class flavin-dependent oxidoreductase [Bacillus sp. T3]|uniref:LLM class flavin-dependent oxidoreductase n=1 Tax=Bacillus sp. T3 TaxID=467262 RepID=UPI00298129B1|nr:LLM class flavin-dependent oxidoreductase [Bacillus sp. T3]
MVEFVTMAPTSGDGEFVGAIQGSNTKNVNSWTGTDESAERQPTQEYIKEIALAAEKGGFSTLLLPIGAGCLDPIVVAANLIAYTDKLKILFAARPDLIAPTALAKQFSTLSYWSGDRVSVNVVTGGSPTELASDGDHLDHEARYRRTREYIQILKKLFAGETVYYEGEFYHLKGATLYPKPSKTPKIFFGGASDIGKKVAADEADVYMLWGETLENTEKRIAEIKQLAAERNRELSYSISFQVVLDETEEKAWQKAERLLSKTPRELLEKKGEMTETGDSVGVKRLHQLMKSGKDHDFKIGPNLWAGLTQVLSGNSIALVGTPDQVADRIVEFVQLGFDKVLLRGFPHLETITEVGKLVIPRVHERLNKAKVS